MLGPHPHPGGSGWLDENRLTALRNENTHSRGSSPDGFPGYRPAAGLQIKKAARRRPAQQALKRVYSLPSAASFT